ncbi:questin oxidase family protein [Myxococcus sp. K38C18041901]|uniref:questin oxidase family protein n=1 Tax=Myxococcus guangdongensis TaxID=2906760 RepID=UPI0020A7AC44|nr:questin oxidase family protein [Myxococcus guangdongensis]MCP3061442.1 questin oxidase family protein [Myxococcus guangdongensis]
MTLPRWVDELLDDRRYHIEFNGHLTNHVKHAVVALVGLGASEQRVRAYYEQYARLTPYGYGLEPPRAPRHVITEASWAEHLGRRTSYASYCELMERLIQERGMDAVLARYLPRLLPGWVGAFTHATIHLGWALDIDHPWMAVEGLAYMAFSFVSCHPERIAPPPPERPREGRALDSLLRIAGRWEDPGVGLRRWVEEAIGDPETWVATGTHPELARSGLQYRIARMLEVGHPLMYETPAWLDTDELPAVWEQLYHAVTLLYLAQPGDFVLLHLITSLHAMEQIAQRLPPEQHRSVARLFWLGMLGIVFSRADFPQRATLAALGDSFQDAVDIGGPPRQGQDWEHIVARAFEEAEEHNPKLVYVLHRVWKRSGCRALYRVAAGCFTSTPELPKSFEHPPTEE